MDYNDEFGDDTLPKRKDPKYIRIEKFKPYELTHCMVFEMACRNEDVRKSIELIAMIEEVLKVEYRIKPDNNEGSLDQYRTLGKDVTEVSAEEYETLNKKKQQFLKTYQEGIRILKSKYYIHYDQNAVNIPEIENPFKKDVAGISIEEFEAEFSDALSSPMMKHIAGKIGEFLSDDGSYSSYKSDHNIYDGFVTARGIEPKCTTFNISSINSHFQRKVYDTNQINVALNMSLEEDELVEYIKHIKKTLSDENTKDLKSPNKLFGKDTSKAQKTDNFPVTQTSAKLADMFFVYDYITARLKEDEYCSQLMTDEYNENKNNVKNSTKYTSRDKAIQLEALKEEYDENQSTTKVKEILEDFDESIEGINFKGSAASKRYYSLKPYIEECRYPEFLTGESVIEDTEDEDDSKK